MTATVTTIFGATYVMPVSIAEQAGLHEHISIAEAAGRAGLTPWQVGQLVVAGQLPAVAVNGRTYVDAAAAEAMV